MKFYGRTKASLTFCEDETPEQKAAAEAAAAEAAANAAANKGGTPKSFTQDEVDKIIDKRFRKEKEEKEKMVKELTSLRESDNLTKTQKEELDSRLRDLESQLLSKDQLVARETKRIEEAKKKELDVVAVERDEWKSLYTTSTIEKDLLEAAREAKALNPEQVKRMLLGDTRLVMEEGSGVAGKRKKYKTMVAWVEQDKEGNTQEVLVPITEAVKRMKEDGERFGNLFDSGAKGGVGGQNTPAANMSKGVTPTTLSDPAEYRKNRETVMAKVNTGR